MREYEILRKEERENSRQYVYRVLKDDILNWKYSPGEIINDLAISERLGVSRTPVREALFTLRTDHLVSVFARNKTMVSLIDWQLITEGRFVRTALETLIAKDLCGKLSDRVIDQLYENIALQRNLVEGGRGLRTFFELDDEFHRILFHAAEKDETYNIVHQMCYQVDRVRSYMIPRSNLIENMMKHHVSILEYIINDEQEKLEKTLEHHINDIFEEDGEPATSAINLLKTHPEYFSNVPEDFKMV